MSINTRTNVIYPKTEIDYIPPADQVKLRERILKESTTTRSQLWYVLCALQLSREVAKQQNRPDWIGQINTWIDRLGAMYNSLFYLQANVYEFGFTRKLRVKALQAELKNIKAIRTDSLVIKCFQQMPDALNVPVNTIEEEIAMYSFEQARALTAEFSGAGRTADPWDI